MNDLLKLGVIGMPIAHSLSPKIHNQFARQFSHQIDYQKFLVEPGELTPFVRKFFADGGHGLNVTLPHKHAAAQLVDKLTPQANLTASVNTIFKDEAGQLVGDTTDGCGLLLDLKRLKFGVSGKHLLIVGAGGASSSIVGALLGKSAQLSVFNRTSEKAKALVNQFSDIGLINIAEEGERYDGVISTISEFNEEVFKQFDGSYTEDAYCYELNYGARAESLKQFSISKGLKRFADGKGMLIGQAAHSYFLWTGEMPSVEGIEI